MKYVFMGCFLVLVAASTVTVLTGPEMQTDVPVIYWVSDANPARVEQIALFHQWLVDHGYTTEDGKPFVELRLDSANRDGSKQIIQGVSGVAGDIMDCDITRFQALGILEDVTDAAKKLGFDIPHTYAALEPTLTVDGRQYGFPCNVNSMAYWVNVETFEKYGMDPPPRTWDFETFERIGKEFVSRANPPGQRQTVFFTDAISGWTGAAVISVMHRSLGLSMFNETLTRCTLDDPRYAQVLGLVYKWTYEDHLCPSAADEASFATESGYGGAQLALFQHGHYAMISIGRWCLIRIRKFEHPPRLSISHYPFEDFPNAPIDTRAAGVYIGGQHKDKATLFLAFLASEAYNQHIVKDADALPPSPAYTRSEAYLRPPEYPNEWGCHEVPVEAAETIAIGYSVSPFVPRGTASDYKDQGLQKVLAHLATPEEAGRWTAQRINAEIELTLKESAKLREKYEALMALQKKIDQYRAEDRRVPLEWIKNPFYRRYYVHQGWAEVNRL